MHRTVHSNAILRYITIGSASNDRSHMEHTDISRRMKNLQRRVHASALRRLEEVRLAHEEVRHE